MLNLELSQYQIKLLKEQFNLWHGDVCDIESLILVVILKIGVMLILYKLSLIINYMGVVYI